MADALRMELWNTGVRVANINPGVIETNIHAVTNSKLDRLKNSRFEKAYKKYLRGTHKGLPASIVADAIVDAISSPNPRPRYVIGSGREKAGIRLRHYIPDTLFYSQAAKRILA